MKAELTSLTNEIYLRAPYCEIEGGACIFRQIIIFGAPSNTYELQIQLLYLDNEINKTFKLSLKECSRGEIFIEKACLECPANFYSFNGDFSINPPPLCLPCQLNAQCSGMASLIPNKGFWRMNENTSKIITCLTASACPYQKDWELTSFNNILTFECGSGYTGLLCKSASLVTDFTIMAVIYAAPIFPKISFLL